MHQYTTSFIPYKLRTWVGIDIEEIKKPKILFGQTV